MDSCLQRASSASPERWPLRLAVFDLDGTIKEASSPWMYLHRALGTETRAEMYHQQFIRGEISYLDWARLDSAVWKGVPLSRVQDIFRHSVYRPGVRELFEFLHRWHVPCAVVSTGLTVQAEQVAADLGVWRTVANELEVQDGLLTGRAVVHVMEDTKGQIMSALRQEAGARPEECLAVGDGTADIDLFAQAGLAVAVCPRSDNVRNAAHHVIEDGDLSAIIPLIEGHFWWPDG
ncbi:MAG TPA: HAD family phosphatase [Anaerolineae bacterium]|nr:HAD family phosphatase [Anaerolineae bacterium]HNT06557.1 HAD family phosphatase [Anaerolineae bacterium]